MPPRPPRCGRHPGRCAAALTRGYLPKPYEYVDYVDPKRGRRSDLRRRRATLLVVADGHNGLQASETAVGVVLDRLGGDPPPADLDGGALVDLFHAATPAEVAVALLEHASGGAPRDSVSRRWPSPGRRTGGVTREGEAVMATGPADGDPLHPPGSVVLGYTKRIAECITATFGARASGTYLSVRFGNVLASRGSVVTMFRAQVAAGGPVTVTHPEASRYFMTVEEACQLVIQAGAIGRSGEALVLDMGEPVCIDDVAWQVEIEYIGLRPGEKLHEQPLGSGELDHRPRHALISQVDVPCMDVAEVINLEVATLHEDLVAGLRGLAAEPSGCAMGPVAGSAPLERQHRIAPLPVEDGGLSARSGTSCLRIYLVAA